MTSTTMTPVVIAGAITWFEVPARDLEAATRFYETTLGAELKRETFGGTRMAMFPCGAGGQRGCLIEGKGMAPSDHGAIVYLGVPDLDAAMARGTAAGGRALTPVIELPDGIGRIAHMLDAEGGRIALHEPGARGE